MAVPRTKEYKLCDHPEQTRGKQLAVLAAHVFKRIKLSSGEAKVTCLLWARYLQPSSNMLGYSKHPARIRMGW